jgi:hypothetical protein
MRWLELHPVARCETLNCSPQIAQIPQRNHRRSSSTCVTNLENLRNLRINQKVLTKSEYYPCKKDFWFP